MSRADMAAALRRVSRIKASERGIRGWERGEYTPGADVIPAYAQATGLPLDFFYSDDEQSADDDEEAASMSLSRDLAVAIERVVDSRVRQAAKR